MVGTDITQTLTNKDLTSGTNTFPTFNQSTTGNAATATKLQTARNIQTNLASTGSASFDGTAAVTPGVTGTLGVANGGTGATTLASGQYLKGNGTGAVQTSATIPVSDPWYWCGIGLGERHFYYTYAMDRHAGAVQRYRHQEQHYGLRHNLT